MQRRPSVPPLLFTIAAVLPSTAGSLPARCGCCCCGVHPPPLRLVRPHLEGARVCSRGNEGQTGRQTAERLQVGETTDRAARTDPRVRQLPYGHARPASQPDERVPARRETATATDPVFSSAELDHTVHRLQPDAG
jgi:hypothetical protein